MTKSALQIARAAYQPKLPKALASGAVKAVAGAATQSVADQEAIKALFPNTYGMPLITFEAGEAVTLPAMNVGVILSGGQAPGGHNVISGLFDGIKKLNPDNKLYGFILGPGGLVDHNYMELTADIIDEYRNTGGFDIIGSGRTKLEAESQFENGFEIIEARMTDVIRKTYFYQDAQIKEYHLNKPIDQKVWYRTADTIFDFAHKLTDSIAKEHPLYEPACRMDELVKDSDPIIHHTFDAGEGVLIPGEILHHAKHGCKFFLILQPFGCLPNHVVGRGITKKLKEIYPDVQILPLDYDPDVSFANIENRLQMLVMNAKQAKRRVSVVQKKENKKETVKKGKIHKQESYC